MSNRLTTNVQGFRTHRSRAWLLPCLAIAMLVPTHVFAQPIHMVGKSVLYTLTSEQILIVSVGETNTLEPAVVTIEIRDAANVVRASTPPLNLVLGQPVILSYQVPASIRFLQLWALVEVIIPTSPEVHNPTISLEKVTPRPLMIEMLLPCALPIDQMPSQGGGAEGTCDGWHLTSRTAGASSEKP